MKSNTLIIISIVVLILLEAAGVFAIGIWREYFWEAVKEVQVHKFFYYITIFSGIALALCFITGYCSYLVSMASLNIRTRLTNKVLGLPDSNIENYGQRIQEDCFSYPQGTVQLLTGALRTILSLIIFSYLILMHLSWYYLLFPVLYATIATGIAGYIAHPLIELNYINQVKEATFRQTLTTVIYSEVVQNNLNLFIKTKYLAYFQSFYSQVSVIVPYLLLSGLYFGHQINFGILMQESSSLIEIITALSYLINSFNDINRWLSCRKRLVEAKII